ncbi:DUF6491 family protein [Sinimarinibacterium thermocellulolyticum]|uniref:DUF6491 family protein n=1 Tax=Sinimarinibacterium thermocellulolyticum TaxID=3170016 RepID=A0ABV2A6N3_9GAMM
MSLDLHRIVMPALLLTLVGACATPSAQDLPTMEQRLAARGLSLGAPVERIADYRIDGWNRLDDEHILVGGGVSERYLISLMQPCPDLGSAETIGFRTTGSVLTRLDILIVESPIGPRRCPIREIHTLVERPREG